MQGRSSRPCRKMEGRNRIRLRSARQERLNPHARHRSQNPRRHATISMEAAGHPPPAIRPTPPERVVHLHRRRERHNPSALFINIMGRRWIPGPLRIFPHLIQEPLAQQDKRHAGESLNARPPFRHHMMCDPAISIGSPARPLTESGTNTRLNCRRPPQFLSPG